MYLLLFIVTFPYLGFPLLCLLIMAVTAPMVHSLMARRLAKGKSWLLPAVLLTYISYCYCYEIRSWLNEGDTDLLFKGTEVVLIRTNKEKISYFIYFGEQETKTEDAVHTWLTSHQSKIDVAS
jgi:hypothetical protein